MPRSYQVRSDGKDLTFTPGKGGSLMYQAKMGPHMNFHTPEKRAKVISDKAMRNRMGLAKVLAGKSGY